VKAFRQPKPAPELRERFVAQLERLLERLEQDTRIEIKEAIGALSLIDRYLAREKGDDEHSGAAIRKFEGAFKAADGAGRGDANGVAAAEPSPGGYDQGGNGSDPAEPADDGDPEDDLPTAA
jgi:hypothetical protein